MKIFSKTWIFLLGIGIFGLSGCMEKEMETECEAAVTISILAGQSTSDAGIEDMITDAVKEKFPQIELEWECVDWGQSFDERMLARISSGDIPDIIVGKSQDVLVYAKNGILAEIAPRGMEKIYPEALENIKIEDKYYGLPYNAWYQGVLYRKDLFEQYDFVIPKEKEELYRIIEELEANGETAFAGHFQEVWKTGNLWMQMMLNEVFAEEPLWGDLFRKGTVSFQNNKEIEECLEEVKYIYDHAFSDAQLLMQAESDKRFDEGRAAMYPGGCWSLQFAGQMEIEAEYGIFPYPNEEGNSRLIRETNMTFMKSAFTKHGELVDEIFQILIDDIELLKEILEFTQTYSVREDVEAGGIQCISEDISKYEDAGQVIEADVGNTQLIWSFQNQLAEKILEWLQHTADLEDVLSYADSMRQES